MTTVRIFHKGRDTGNVIDRVKNRAYTESLYGVPHIIESAYKRGIYEFYNGARIPMTFTPPQAAMVERRKTAINLGKDTRKIEYLTHQLTDQHIVIEDVYEGSTLIESNGFYTVQAPNPYRNGSLFAKEWQRGFDTGYNRTQKKNEAKHR